MCECIVHDHKTHRTVYTFDDKPNRLRGLRIWWTRGWWIHTGPMCAISNTGFFLVNLIFSPNMLLNMRGSYLAWRIAFSHPVPAAFLVVPYPYPQAWSHSSFFLILILILILILMFPQWQVTLCRRRWQCAVRIDFYNTLLLVLRFS